MVTIALLQIQAHTEEAVRILDVRLILRTYPQTQRSYYVQQTVRIEILINIILIQILIKYTHKLLLN